MTEYDQTTSIVSDLISGPEIIIYSELCPQSNVFDDGSASFQFDVSCLMLLGWTSNPTILPPWYCLSFLCVNIIKSTWLFKYTILFPFYHLLFFFNYFFF